MANAKYLKVIAPDRFGDNTEYAMTNKAHGNGYSK
jgi:hypothetical protein